MVRSVRCVKRMVFLSFSTHRAKNGIDSGCWRYPGSAAPVEAIEGRKETANTVQNPANRFHDWLPAPARAMCVSARKEEGQRMQDKTFPTSGEAISGKLASLRSLPIKELKQRWRSLYSSEPPASRQPRAADPCGGIPHPGTSPRRTQTSHS
jgi:hypothetical protein